MLELQKFDAKKTPSVTVLVVNQDKLDDLKNSITSLNQLQIIADFDFTLTKKVWMKPNDEDWSKYGSGSSFAGAEIEPVMNAEQIERQNAIRAKYEPIEADANSDNETRAKACDIWWIDSFNIIATSNFTRESLSLAIKNQKSIRMKEGFKSFYEKFSKLVAQKHMLILSAGIKNVISEVFHQNDIEFPNELIFSNEIDFETRKIINQDMMITSWNKNSSIIPKEFLLESVKFFLIIGDNIEDHKMMDESHLFDASSQRIFRIGLVNIENLNDDVATKATLNKFADKFDLILINDETFEPISEFLNYITGDF